MLDKRLSAINKRDKLGYVRPLGYPPRETSEISAGFRGAEISLSHERLFDEMGGWLLQIFLGSENGRERGREGWKEDGLVQVSF